MKKNYDDDDGRTVADMRGIKRQPLWIPNFQGASGPEKKETDRPENAGPEMSAKERRMYVFAALKASALIGLAFLAGLGLLIFVLTLILK